MISIDKFKAVFILQRKTISDALSKGDYKANNIAMKKLQSLFKKLETDLNTAELILSDLLLHPDISVQIGAAVFCLSLRIRTNEAERILGSASSNCANKLLAFNARMTLEIWKKQGYLLIYPNQSVIDNTD